jgi:polyphosphate kinase 2 (PPK2 family)
VLVLKFFLNVSRDEQKQRFLERLSRPEKHWKFSAQDVAERRFWNHYQRAYEDCIRHTSTPWAPWFIIPADRKWFTRLAISELIVHALKTLNPAFPKVSKEHQRELRKMRALLQRER